MLFLLNQHRSVARVGKGRPGTLSESDHKRVVLDNLIFLTLNRNVKKTRVQVPR